MPLWQNLRVVPSQQPLSVMGPQLVWVHWPPESQVSYDLHVPQVPPQLSGPHFLPEHWGWQPISQIPTELQVSPVGHVPQLLPQPSGPHSLLLQLGW